MRQLGHAVLSSLVCADGGPRRYVERGLPLPDKYLPGRYMQRLEATTRAELVREIAGPAPADWYIKKVVG